jgi:hypothetical protein
MSQEQNRTRWKIEGRTLTEVMDAALRRMAIDGNGAGEDEASFTLVFAGEGQFPEDALQAAMEDIREQCLAQGGVPTGIETSGVMTTDTGTRIWGTVMAVPGAPSAQRVPGTSSIVIREEEEEGRWTLTTMTE